MSPKNFMLVVVTLLASSVALEITLLAGVFSLGDYPYHGIHLTLMGILAGSQFALYFYGRRHGVKHRLALFFAVGACLTATGDFVNSAVSQIEPVSLKLTWALLLFGAGYTLYNIALWQHNDGLLRGGSSKFARYRYLIALPILAINVVSWFTHVEPNVDGFDLLYYGSFIFNATIYVFLPTFAIWFFYNSGRSVGGLIVLVGALLIPYSDLILFSSWMRSGDPAVPGFELYAFNWIVYFGGQALISIFPALVIEEELGSAPTRA
ncbi:MAG: hypothetical protein JHC87_01085 [Thermoleophilaceae bacterium]|nr:hypothetical protein [Thermoleophilaceae bacterium]